MRCPFSELERTIKKPFLEILQPAPATIGEHIRKTRIEKSMLQSEVSKIIGVSIESITNWENNNSQPQIRYYPKIVAFLGYAIFNNQLDETLSKRIKAYRITHGLSHKKLGIVLSVNASTICSWEKNEFFPSKVLVTKINKLLT